MINVEEVRTLSLCPATTGNSAPFISAASGLAWVDDHLYVVADDALHLGIFDVTSAAPGSTFPLLAGELPEDHKARKAQKPDFEVLARWPHYPGAAGGALVALGSGSKKNRSTGVLLMLASDGSLSGEVRVFSLAGLYGILDDIIPALNIEGAVFTDSELWLFQRGNSEKGKNAIIRLAQSDFVQWVEAGDSPAEITPALRVQEISLGALADVPLGFTDATRLPDGEILFAAAAEDTSDTYNDGQCAGSVIGRLSTQGKLLWKKPLDVNCKVEGLAVQVTDQEITCLMVTDADDPGVPAALLRAHLPR